MRSHTKTQEMKTTNTSKFLIVICILAIASLLNSCKKTKEEIEIETPAPQNNIVYIYKSDNTDGLAYKALLEENECHVTLIDKSQASTTDYKSYKLIVIDNNTDITGTNVSWTNADSATLKNSGKPILFLGMGGIQLARKLGNIVNQQNSATFTDKGFWVSNKTSPLYKQPYVITIPTSTPQVVVYKTAVGAAGTYGPDITSSEVTLFGRFVVNNNYYPVSTETKRYATFGFFEGVENMTTDGRNFMVNLAYYTGNLVP